MPTQLPRAAAFDLETCADAAQGHDARNPNEAIPVQAALVLIHTTGEPLTPRSETGPMLLVHSTHTHHDIGVDAHTLTNWPTLANPGIPINPEAAEVHGITDDQVANARPEGEVMANLRNELANALLNDYVLVAANAHYDFTVLDRRNRANPHPDNVGDALGRTLGHQIKHLSAPTLVMDPMVIDRHVDKFRRGKRTLTDLAAYYRVPLGNAHDAGADALAAALILARIFAVAEAITDPATADARPGANEVRTIAVDVIQRDARGREPIAVPRYRQLAEMTADDLYHHQIAWRAEWAEGFQDWLRTKAPADRRDADAVVDGSWPILPLPQPAV